MNSTVAFHYDKEKKEYYDRDLSFSFLIKETAAFFDSIGISKNQKSRHVLYFLIQIENGGIRL